MLGKLKVTAISSLHSILNYVAKGLLAVLFFCTAAHADLSDDFVARLQSMQTLQGSFSQTLSDPVGVELQRTQGTFTLQRPDHFYWKTLPPYSQEVISNTQKVWVYDPDLEQVTVHSRSSIANSPAAILSANATQIDDAYYVESHKDGNKDVFTLLPKKGQVDIPFQRIEFSFEGELLTELVLYDSLDQQTRIVLSEIRLNEDVDEAIFHFKAPQGVDVIFAE